MRPGGVAYVILGALRAEPKSGYEIKRLVDKAIRFFWAASFGQIYPELRSLEGEGLIEQHGKESDGRRRVLYRLTPAGRSALAEWLRAPAAGYELRDEGLLKLFFADALDPTDALALVRSIRAERQGRLDRLRQIEAVEGCPGLVLAYGIEFHEWSIEWCSRLEQQLEAQLTEGGVPA